MNSSDYLSKSCTFSSVNGQAESDTSNGALPWLFLFCSL